MQSNKTLHIVLDSYLNTFANLFDEMNKEHKEKCHDVKNKILSIFPNLNISDNALEFRKLKEENEKLRIENYEMKNQLDKIPKIIKHKITIYLEHTQDWSYGIKFNFFNNKIIGVTGQKSPGIITGLFPKNKTKYIIGDAEILSQKNQLDGKECGMARSLNIDTHTGIIWSETPYGYKYGREVTWNTEITFIISYLDL